MIQAVLLGNAQDAGVPQAGCRCANCQAAWHAAAQRKKVCALGLLDADAGAWFLVDATHGNCNSFSIFDFTFDL
ncbi:MAG: hypothetical protein HY327_12200 [Chloroflexi bacterium]|nr:hypothetical protein [Chloroflexota bacterium]